MPAIKEPISQEFSLDRLKNLLFARDVVFWHDVDFEPRCAVDMAVLEFQLGVKSTYYVRPLDSYKSPQEAHESFIEISRYGHELGTHVDLLLGRRASVPADYMKFCCEDDYRELSRELPMSKKVSFHAPPADALWRTVEGFEHALTQEWMNRYVADSRGVFRRSPELLIARASSLNPAALNTHPEWWFLPPYEREVLFQRELVAP